MSFRTFESISAPLSEVVKGERRRPAMLNTWLMNQDALRPGCDVFLQHVAELRISRSTRRDAQQHADPERVTRRHAAPAARDLPTWR